MFLLKSIDFWPLVPQKLSVESSINNDVHQKSMFNVHRFYIDEMVETWSAKVCAENHNARDTFFALTFLITCVQFQIRQHTMGYLVLKMCQSIFQLESEYKKSSKLAKNYENSGTHF